MKAKTLKDKWYGMRKLANNSESWQLSQSKDMRNTWCMKELGERPFRNKLKEEKIWQM